jgi:hypothetical protein
VERDDDDGDGGGARMRTRAVHQPGLVTVTSEALSTARSEPAAAASAAGPAVAAAAATPALLLRLHVELSSGDRIVAQLPLELQRIPTNGSPTTAAGTPHGMDVLIHRPMNNNNNDDDSNSRDSPNRTEKLEPMIFVRAQ